MHIFRNICLNIFDVYFFIQRPFFLHMGNVHMSTYMEKLRQHYAKSG